MSFDALLGIVATLAPYLDHIVTLAKFVLSLIPVKARLPIARYFRLEHDNGRSRWLVEYRAKPVAAKSRRSKPPRIRK